MAIVYTVILVLVLGYDLVLFYILSLVMKYQPNCMSLYDF